MSYLSSLALYLIQYKSSLFHASLVCMALFWPSESPGSLVGIPSSVQLSTSYNSPIHIISFKCSLPMLSADCSYIRFLILIDTPFLGQPVTSGVGEVQTRYAIVTSRLFSLVQSRILSVTTSFFKCPSSFVTPAALVTSASYVFPRSYVLISDA